MRIFGATKKNPAICDMSASFKWKYILSIILVGTYYVSHYVRTEERRNYVLSVYTYIT